MDKLKIKGGIKGRLFMLYIVSVDWSKVSEAGIGVVALVAFVVLTAVLVKAFFTVWNRSIDTQEKSNEAITKNTEAYNKLSTVFEKSHEREIEFQREAISLLRTNNTVVNDVHEKVKDIHKKIT